MRKSSLGRRSSTQIPTRIPSIGSTGKSTCSGGKKKRSGSLLRPGFSQTKRSQSEDRESYGGLGIGTTMVRSNTVGTLPGRAMAAMTPKTPKQSMYQNLPTGSSRPSRGNTLSTESNRRMSSFGGTKNTRKDPRPISDTSYQQQAQLKVQRFFEMHGPQDILGANNKIRPMNTMMFLNMMDHLLKQFDTRIVITKSNYLEELPVLLKKFGYRSKVDRSWLMTVNTPHSWQHVIAVLVWLVEAIECMTCIDVFNMMYPQNLADDEEDQEDEDCITINKELITHLLKTRRYASDPSSDDHDDEYIEKLIVDKKCTDEDFETLGREIELLKEEVANELRRRDAQLDKLKDLKAKHKAIVEDFESVQNYIENAKLFVQNTEMKLVVMEQEINAGKALVTKKQEEIQRLQDKMNSQQISIHEKEKMEKEKRELHKMIQCFEIGIREYEKSVYIVDLKCAENQRKLEKLIVEYNRIVAERMIMEPRLKDVEVKYSLLSKVDKESLEVVGSNLRALQEEYKGLLRDLELRKAEADKIVSRIKEDMKETEEDFAKESALLEGLECDLEKQQELKDKESQQLKEEAARYQKMAKEIEKEISQFDPDKLENKKIELEKIKHDWELLQQKGKQLIDGHLAHQQEISSVVKNAIEKRNKKRDEFVKKFLENYD